jgi:hypothetical protein
MSLALTIALIVTLDVALLALLTFAMAQARRLTPHRQHSQVRLVRLRAAVPTEVSYPVAA